VQTPNLFHQYAIFLEKAYPRPAIMGGFSLKKQSEATVVRGLSNKVSC